MFHFKILIAYYLLIAQTVFCLIFVFKSPEIFLSSHSIFSDSVPFENETKQENLVSTFSFL